MWILISRCVFLERQMASIYVCPNRRTCFNFTVDMTELLKHSKVLSVYVLYAYRNSHKIKQTLRRHCIIAPFVIVARGHITSVFVWFRVLGWLIIYFFKIFKKLIIRRMIISSKRAEKIWRYLRISLADSESNTLAVWNLSLPHPTTPHPTPPPRKHAKNALRNLSANENEQAGTVATTDDVQ